MKGEFYKIRGWDVPSGLQRRAKLEELGLKDIARTLESEGLLR
jgi:aldehyde:ferredoxin oxidoreductase